MTCLITLKPNYPVGLLCTDNGLPKPQLISWIELGRELFGSWGEEEKLEKGIRSSIDDVHFHLVIEEPLFESEYEEPGILKWML